MMIVPTSRPIAVRSAAPPPVAPPPVAPAPEPALEGTLFDDKALMDNASSRYRAAAEAQQRADELLRKEQEAVARGAKNKNADPFAHLKEEFAELIHDLYGSQNDTAMAAVGAMSSERAKESCFVVHARSRAPFDTCSMYMWACCRRWRGRKSCCTATCRPTSPCLWNNNNLSTVVEGLASR